MDLYDDLIEERWNNKGNPPSDITPIDGYTHYTVFQRQIVESTGEMILYLKTEQGVPIKAVLSNFKAHRNPMKGVRNCRLKLRKLENNESQVVGILMDRDWVEEKN